jgi:hypothetical protein
MVASGLAGHGGARYGSVWLGQVRCISMINCKCWIDKCGNSIMVENDAKRGIAIQIEHVNPRHELKKKTFIYLDKKSAKELIKDIKMAIR